MNEYNRTLLFLKIFYIFFLFCILCIAINTLYNAYQDNTCEKFKFEKDYGRYDTYDGIDLGTGKFYRTKKTCIKRDGKYINED